MRRALHLRIFLHAVAWGHAAGNGGARAPWPAAGPLAQTALVAGWPKTDNRLVHRAGRILYNPAISYNSAT